MLSSLRWLLLGLIAIGPVVWYWEAMSWSTVLFWLLGAGGVGAYLLGLFDPSSLVPSSDGDERGPTFEFGLEAGDDGGGDGDSD